jgi:hypothetical protein
MSANISAALNATSQQAFARSPVNSAHAVKRASGDPQDSFDAVPRPKNLPQEPVDPIMRAHAAVSTEESLKRLPDSTEPGKYRGRAKKGTEDDAGLKAARPGLSAPGMHSPYDPPPVRQRSLDLLA